MSNSTTVSELLSGQSIVPVVVIENKQQALGLAQALVDGGINVIEITLRNDYGIHAIGAVKTAFPDMLTLAGTVTSAQEMVDVVNAGVDGIISPGLTPALLQTAEEQKIAYLPGVATPSDILLGMQHGLMEFKLFPATVVGGVGALKAFGGPFPELKFCPTGGVGEVNFREFLALANVMCVGGSWIAPAAMIAEENWQGITDLCLAATAS
ncbi:MAG: bifunctional 4-hydroxy-2-oxoglutarate aldolase/2-dehydro-3-deoxy-phosphogluconate aldolase [Gammaproteobacteria bacterium]|nr:bifunctional 4-hydroxy-2-oxoglutarate aldolase/2-dehydro-3-deoxy-phosphogluconate aldolase [Gammaproteobacteria bacterium]